MTSSSEIDLDRDHNAYHLVTADLKRGVALQAEEIREKLRTRELRPLDIVEPPGGERHPVRELHGFASTLTKIKKSYPVIADRPQEIPPARSRQVPDIVPQRICLPG